MNWTFEFTSRIRSIWEAGRGICRALKSQPTAWIHAAATVTAGSWLGISRIEWCLIILAGAAVWNAEALNTAFEFLADATIEEFHPVIGEAKDVAAGAILVTALATLAVDVLVFRPHLVVLVQPTG